MTLPGGAARVQTGRRLLLAITRTGAVLCSSAAVAGLILMAIADRSGVIIESLHGEIGLSLFIFGLIAPFAFWCVHLAVEQWVDETGEFFEGHYSRPVTIAASTAFGVLAFGLFTFAFSPVLAFTPDDGASVVEMILPLIVGSICVAVLVSAIAGGVALFGWPGAVVGTLTGAGFCLVAAGLLLPATPFLVPLGVVLLVLGTLGFLGFRVVARAAGRDV